jgi:hypothetical protein
MHGTDSGIVQHVRVLKQSVKTHIGYISKVRTFSSPFDMQPKGNSYMYCVCQDHISVSNDSLR